MKRVQLEFSRASRLRKTRDSDSLFLDLIPEETSLGQKWFLALCEVLQERKVLEKNFCFLGLPYRQRDLEKIASELNYHIERINYFNWKDGYQISDRASAEMDQEVLNRLHHEFEILIGQVWSPSPYYEQTSPPVRHSIRQINNLVHEFESAMRAKLRLAKDPDTVQTYVIHSFMKCRRYDLSEEDFESFTLSKTFGDAYLHYCQLGKTHHEVFSDQDDSIDRSNINGLRYYTGEFDWFIGPTRRKDVVEREWQKFSAWLQERGWNPEDPRLALGWGKVASLSPKDRELYPTPSSLQQAIGEKDNIQAISCFDGEQLLARCEYPYSPEEAESIVERELLPPPHRRIWDRLRNLMW